MSEPTQAETYLDKARASRASGDLAGCVLSACVAAYHAERDHLPEVLYHAYACVGRAHLLRNEPEDARGWFRNAADVAAMHGLDWHAPSLHDLFLCYRDTNPKQARSLADRALHLFGSGHPDLARFKADLSVFQEPMEKRWALFAPFIRSGVEENYRMIALSNLMEAAAFGGDVHRLLSFWECLSDTLRRRESHEGSAVSLLAAAKVLVRPATIVQGRAAAQWCVALADSRGESLIADEARYLLSQAN